MQITFQTQLAQMMSFSPEAKGSTAAACVSIALSLMGITSILLWDSVRISSCWLCSANPTNGAQQTTLWRQAGSSL